MVIEMELQQMSLSLRVRTASLVLALVGTMVFSAISPPALAQIDPDSVRSKITAVEALRKELLDRRAKVEADTTPAGRRELESIDAQLQEYDRQLAEMNAMLTGAPVVTADGRPVSPTIPANCPLSFNATSYDWGRISDTRTVEFTFKITNTSQRLVNILNVQTTCGCTAPDPSQTRQSLMPGQTGDIRITFDPKGRVGLQQKQVTITTDAPECPSILLNLQSTVAPAVILEPQNVFFGEIPVGTKPGPQTFTVTGRSEGFEVTGISTTNNLFKVDLVGRDVVELDGRPANRFRYSITVSEDLRMGFHMGFLTLNTNDSERPRIENVQLTATVVGPVNVLPSAIAMPYAGPGQPFRQTVTLQQRRNQPMRVLSVDLEGVPTSMRPVLDLVARPTAAGQAPNGSLYSITVAGVFPPSIEQVSGFVVVRTDQSPMEEIRIPLSAYRMAGPVPPPSPSAVPPNVAAPSPAPQNASR
jgi:hypothetical protein